MTKQSLMEAIKKNNLHLYRIRHAREKGRLPGVKGVDKCQFNNYTNPAFRE